MVASVPCANLFSWHQSSGPDISYAQPSSQSRLLCDPLITLQLIVKFNCRFLAATLHMDSLATKMSVKTLKQAIDRLPSTLNRLYDEAFRRIDDQNEDDREFASKALRWVAYTYRPLTVPELEQALAIEPRGRDLDPDAAPDIAFVLEACAGLLIVDKETEQVRLVHYTAQDYLDTLLTSRYQEAHASIAGDCITYLNYDVFQLLHFDDEPDAEPDAEPDDEPDDGEPDNEPDNKPDNEPDVDSDAESEYESYDGSDDERHVKARKGMKHTYYLLSYASEYWAKHCRMAGQRVELGAQLYNFLASDPQIRLFTRDSGLWFEPSPADLRKTNGIAIAACYGICDALRRLLQQNEVDINWKTHQEHSALHLAAMNDEVISVEILLDYGADIECNGQYERTPLMCAIECNSTNTAWLLVERGAATSNEAFNSVHWASPIPFLQLLLNHGADVNARSSYGTQLMGRTREDDVETVRWLLEKGAAVDRRNSLHGQTALFEAGRSGSVDMVELLLVHGANYSIIDDKGNTILHAACKEGKVHLVRRFLDLGIPIDATNFWGDTPSRLAARKGDIECLELLLANKADVDKAGHLGRTPLVAAILEGSTKAVQPLLNAGAKVDLQDGQGCTALHHAVCKRVTSAIRLLLKHHASCGARSSLDLSLRHVSDYVNPESGLIIWGDQGGLRFVNAQALRNSESSRSLELMLRRLITDECRAWKSGMTALDIACVLDDAECIDLLKPLTGSITESTIMTPGDYLCELFGFSSVAELEEEIERREQVLHKKHERMREEMRAERRREREERNQELVERGESEESSSSERW